jgi:hypothetical protein
MKTPPAFGLNLGRGVHAFRLHNRKHDPRVLLDQSKERA